MGLMCLLGKSPPVFLLGPDPVTCRTFHLRCGQPGARVDPAVSVARCYQSSHDVRRCSTAGGMGCLASQVKKGPRFDG